MEIEPFLVYCKTNSADNFGPIGEAIAIAPDLWIVRSALDVSEVARFSKELADGITPVFVCHIGDKSFSGTARSIDGDSRIMVFLGV
jgi:hypothetical protein